MKRIVLLAATTVVAGAAAVVACGPARSNELDPAIVSLYPVAHPRGLMVTSGGWAYCQQVRNLARASGYTLLCGRYAKDGYVGLGLRSRRHEDWGNAAYLDSLAAKVRAVHARVGGGLVLMGVSYSGFAVATLASHHPDLRPQRLIVIDSYLDLVARRAAIQASVDTAREIDEETGGSSSDLASRNVDAHELARLIAGGTRLVVIWSVAPSEQREFNGATCNRAADAGVLLRVATALGRPVPGWVTRSRHGHDLWDHGAQIMVGHPPGHELLFEPGGSVPPGAACL